jgi:hypothetical protein
LLSQLSYAPKSLPPTLFRRQQRLLYHKFHNGQDSFFDYTQFFG